MFMPSIFGDTFNDDFFNMPKDFYYKSPSTTGLMQTDITENDEAYTVSMNLPGVNKEDIKAELKDGYLTVTATTSKKKEDKDSRGRVLRSERYSGSCKRSFYVGKDVTEEDIKGKYTDGVLTLIIPKHEEKPKVEEKKYINIEG
ncbi:MAG: Hsp20/alpha crystallin family protein [Lachnospiraceae bacterium]|nr:Hsp20/alpha crystallin family protein [Lachnospiraceae bacterium]